ncbi:MAG: hypothetical protein WCZ18_06310 [Ottowia sp.]|nr:hypothetical protein [Ottowia sp.]
MSAHYRLGINGLRSSEIALVQTLLRLAAHHREVHWICADQPPWHAVLLDDPDDERLDHGGLEAVLPGLGRDTPYVLRLTGAGSVRRAGAMRRPIRGEKLLAWLDRVEAAAALAGETDAIEPGASAPQSRTAPVVDALFPGAPRRRLLRRLPASLVRNSAERHRMARLLARYALNAQDLHRLSGVAPVECLVFLKVLDAHQLLSPARAARPHGDVVPAPAGLPASWQRAATARPGLARRLANGVFKWPGT